MTIDYKIIRQSIAEMDASAASSATGVDRPIPSQIFAPEHHVGALDPNTTIVLGARGAGKSFWAGVLVHEDTRSAVAAAYPQVDLNTLTAEVGFSGQAGDGSVSRATIDALVEPGAERVKAVLLWRCVILRAVLRSADPDMPRKKISTMMVEYADPEEWEEAMEVADRKLAQTGSRVLIIFDALDGLSEHWSRLRDLTDALLEVAWSIRGYKMVRAKLFLRPDQLRDLGLRFVELPKMTSGATNLVWLGVDLYGLLFARLVTTQNAKASKAFRDLLDAANVPPAPPGLVVGLRRWRLSRSRPMQAKVFRHLAGDFMGRSNKKGRTYDWPLNHLADGHREVTPRSFLTLMIAAANAASPPDSQALSAEGIRIGLRQASKVRLEQLDTEFKWIKRVLAPLARLQVPCSADAIIDRWEESSTIAAVMKQARIREFLPPFQPSMESEEEEEENVRLISRLVRMGVLTQRADGRFDMPDLFRVAARLLRKGGVAPE
ncbi:MAG: hypothetical protein V4475_21015 [Pseudomonadota bacterium]